MYACTRLIIYSKTRTGLVELGVDNPSEALTLIEPRNGVEGSDIPCVPFSVL